MTEYFNPYAINQVFVESLTDNNEKKIFDISDLVSGIQYSTFLEGQPSKLTFTLQKDPSGKLSIHNGSKIQFRRDGKGIFLGYVFNMGTDATETYKITAYDQMRYLKNEDTRLVANISVGDLFKKICDEFQLKNNKLVVPCNFVCPKKVYEGQTLFSILNDQIQKANIDANKEGTSAKDRKYYFLRDNFGTLELNEISQLKSDVLLGEASLLSSYQFEISTDKNTYNQIKLVKKYNDKDEKGKKIKGGEQHIVPYVVKDSGTQKVWGILQKVINVDENMNKGEITDLGKKYLKQMNRETRTLKLSALGVDGITSGVGIKVDIPHLRTNKDGKTEFIDMWVVNATHNYNKDMHTMELDVAIP